MLKIFSIPEIFTFSTGFFGYVEQRLDKKARVNFKIYEMKFTAMKLAKLIKYSIRQYRI